MIDSKTTEKCIDCTVKNCVYHTSNNSCSAGAIKVGNSTACSCSETCCDTFKAKD